MPLDTFGKLAAAQIAFYVPIAGLTLFLTFRYALRRDAGWLFLAIFSLARVAGGAVLLAAQLTPANPTLFLVSYILQPGALALLLLSTIGFLGMAGQHTYSEIPRVTVFFRIFGILGLIGMGLTIAGCVLGSSVAPNSGSAGWILRRAGASVYGAVYIFLLLAFFGTFSYRWHLRSYRRNLLWGVGAALPFLGVRVAYGIMAAWSASDLLGTKPSSNPTLAKMNPVTGDWLMFLVLGLVMEFVTCGLFMLASTILAQRRR
ncbi:hypothetical protein D9611_003452 [Ephemerocybe angulata]|uniref:Uncharacterized protein n=2 Tax=Ephemerocybe angulata TaxID=980116 RepID=A0A8H5C8J2_9AGAR|nr:hypothetical protein D9611_003452 [Tulosesus angulatus]KAF6766483.1 hypothetical protein DFP72DRAFT_1162078 [Tulosesus angulatus]